MTDNTPNRQPENQAARSEPAIETQTTEPQTQPEKPAEPVAQSAPQKQPEKAATALLTMSQQILI